MIGKATLPPEGSPEWQRNHEVFNVQCIHAREVTTAIMEDLWDQLAPAHAPATVKALAISAIPTGAVVAAAQRLRDCTPEHQHKQVEEVLCELIRSVMSAGALAGMLPVGRA